MYLQKKQHFHICEKKAAFSLDILTKLYFRLKSGQQQNLLNKKKISHLLEVPFLSTTKKS